MAMPRRRQKPSASEPRNSLLPPHGEEIFQARLVTGFFMGAGKWDVARRSPGLACAGAYEHMGQSTLSACVIER
ncbi:hypothetical protein PSm6_02610 [Pseudomonas solani]|uniref:Uncharacterized protein n=1 Tax=Pseudomonas solani TaxID=2731552 RepID=A0ABM7L2S8_9PSED|nr:hypothetical protein PSm6_02610 [Pseudomonas solani]